jgi:hypothetical protein
VLKNRETYEHIDPNWSGIASESSFLTPGRSNIVYKGKEYGRYEQ